MGIKNHATEGDYFEVLGDLKLKEDSQIKEPVKNNICRHVSCEDKDLCKRHFSHYEDVRDGLINYNLEEQSEEDTINCNYFERGVEIIE